MIRFAMHRPAIIVVKSLPWFTLSVVAGSAAPTVGTAPGPCPTNQTSTTRTPNSTQSGTSQTAILAAANPGITTGSNVSGGNGRGSNQPTSRPSVDIPQVNTTAAEVARADAASAHTAATKAQTAFSTIAAKLQKEFDARPDVVEATKAVSAGKAAYDAAAAPVLASLKTRSDFNAALTTAFAAQEQVASLKGDSGATPLDRLNAAKAALAAKEVVTKMQSEALNASSPVVTAKTAYSAAISALAKLRQQFTDSLKQDPQWLRAKESLDDAKSKATSADQAVASAQKDLAAQQAASAAALAQQRQLDRAMAAQQAQGSR